MRTRISGITLSAALASSFFLLLAGRVVAQSNDTEYCYGSVCGTQKEAEDAMRSAYPDYASYFTQKGEKVGFVNGKLMTLYISYSVPDQPPQSMNQPVYGPDFGNPPPEYCAPSGDPIYPRACTNDRHVIQGFVNFYVNIYGANRVSYEVDGGYFSPFSEASGFGTPPAGAPARGWLRHNNERTAVPKQKTVTVTVFREDGTIAYGHGGTVRVLKFTSYTCPAGFVANSGSHPSYNPSATKLLTSPTCSATVAEQTITTRLRQTSCPVDSNASPALGKNPCYPATGDKARFETDFEFSGRPFTRSYHSLRQAGQLPELAPGWVHAYSDRISGNFGVQSEPVLWTTDSGYLEIFKRVGSSNRFVSEGNASNVLDVEPNDTLAHKFIVTSQGTLVRYFNSAGRLIRIEDRSSAWNLQFAYQGDRLIAATDHAGKQLLFDYQNNRLATVYLPDGTSVTYGYDADSNLQSVQYPDSTTKTYHYNEAGLSDANDRHALTGITDNGLRFSTYAYDNKGRVRLSQFQTAEGPTEKTELVYTGDTQVAVTGHNGEVTNYTIASDSGYRRVMSAATSVGVASNSYTGALTFEIRDRLQNITRYEYAANNAYVSARYDAYGTEQERKTVMVRDANYRLTSVQLQAKVGAEYVTKRAQSWTYNARGQILTATTTDPATSVSRTTTKTYCEQDDVTAATCPIVGLVKSVDGARTDVADITTFTYHMSDPPGCVPGVNPCYHRKGDLKTITNALGHATYMFGYDDAGRSTGMVDANGVTTEFEYDARGRLIARKLRGADGAIETDDQIIRLEYWPNGLVKKVIHPDGALTAYVYDGAQRLTGIADNAGNSINYTLNAAGARTREDTKDSQGVLLRTLSRTYNTLGQLQTQTDAYNRSTGFAYDANGNLDVSTDALLRETDNNYDPINRLSRTLQDINGIAAETKFRYDVLDNLTQVNDPKGLNTDYTHNGFSDLTQLQSPDTGTTLYTYDIAGNRKTQKDARNKTTTYNYDVLNRLMSITYAATALNTTFTYDTAQAACVAGETLTVGRLTKIVDQSGDTVYCYDRFGNLVRKVQTTNGKIFTLRYVYAVNGQLQKIVYPDGAEADYLYDTQGRVFEIGAKTATGTRQVLLTNATYYPFGPVARWTYGTGTASRSMQRNFNLNYQPDSLEVIAAGGLNVGYDFDEVSNLKRLRNASPTSPPRRLFGYDALNRLTESKDGTNNALLEGYTYDKTGNRASATVGAITTPYTYPVNSHRLNTVGAAAARVYDANGNTISIPGTVVKNFVYGDHGRMTQYKEGTAVKMNYVYNGRGEQVRKYASSTTNIYSLYDEVGHWLGDYDNAAAATQQVIWFGDLPVGVLVGAGAAQKLHYIEADALGTPRVVVDPTRGVQGTAVWTWDLAGEAFGTTAPNQNPDGDATQFVFNMRFPGQRYDSVSGMNYNYFRDYEASIGRYMESDPIGFLGGISTFGYAAMRPLIAIDPTGLLFGFYSCNAGICRGSPPVPNCDSREECEWSCSLKRRKCNRFTNSAAIVGSIAGAAAIAPEPIVSKSCAVVAAPIAAVLGASALASAWICDEEEMDCKIVCRSACPKP